MAKNSKNNMSAYQQEIDSYINLQKTSPKHEKPETDVFLSGLSKEARSGAYDFLDFAVIASIVLILGISFLVIKRDSDTVAPKITVQKIISGEYLRDVSKYYSESLPLKSELAMLGNFFDGFEAVDFGFGKKDSYTPTPPASTSASTSATTTVSETTATVTSSEIPTETEIPETFIMYATASVNVRIGEGPEFPIIGYLSRGDEVEVVENLPSGWSKILYRGDEAYVSTEYLSDEPASTQAPVWTTADTEPTEEETSLPEDTSSDISEDTSDSSQDETEVSEDTTVSQTEQTTTTTTVQIITRPTTTESAIPAVTEPPVPFESEQPIITESQQALED